MEASRAEHSWPEAPNNSRKGVALGALTGLFVALDTAALPATLGLLAGAGTGALLALLADGTQPQEPHQA